MAAPSPLRWVLRPNVDAIASRNWSRLLRRLFFGENMPLTTGTGDEGQTTWRSIRILKNSREIAFLGLMDRAMAEVSQARILARALQAEAVDSELKRVSRALCDVCAIMAADAERDLIPVVVWAAKKTLGRTLTEFVDFGETTALAAAVNLARTGVRLAESHLPDACDEQNPLIRPLMNRLSDVLFIIAVDCAEGRLTADMPSV